MESLAQRLESIRVKVKAPGVAVYAEIRGRDRVTISFGSDVYRWVDERHLERHMTTLARLLFVGWNRAYRAALTDHFLGHVKSGPSNTHDLAFLAARDLIVATGQSPGGQIRLAARGLRQISIEITDGTLRAMSEHDFAEHTRHAVMELIRDHTDKIYELKMRFYT